MEKYVIGIIYENGSDALTDATREYCRLFRDAGYKAKMIDYREERQARRFLAYAQEGRILFGFGLQGVGSQLPTPDGRNIWSAIRTPFLSIHHDHPCHNPLNHVCESPYVANVYRFASFLDAHERFLPKTNQVNAYVPLRLVNRVPEGSIIPFNNRQFRFLFVKTGVALNTLDQKIEALPSPLKEGLYALVQEAMGDPNAELADLVARLYASLGVNFQDYQQQFWTHVKWLDEYIRCSRAIRLVEWLKGQSGALIIGDGWDFIDKTDSKAFFKPAQSGTVCWQMTGDTQFVCNTNPYGRDVIHERVISGFLQNACVISDSNAWWDANFAEIPALIRFGWDASPDDQIEKQLAQTGAAQASTGRQAALAHFAPNGVDSLIEVVERVRHMIA